MAVAPLKIIKPFMPQSPTKEGQASHSHDDDDSVFGRNLCSLIFVFSMSLLTTQVPSILLVQTELMKVPVKLVDKPMGGGVMSRGAAAAGNGEGKSLSCPPPGRIPAAIAKAPRPRSPVGKGGGTSQPSTAPDDLLAHCIIEIICLGYPPAQVQ